jgi:hypothetical protein
MICKAIPTTVYGDAMTTKIVDDVAMNLGAEIERQVSGTPPLNLTLLARAALAATLQEMMEPSEGMHEAANREWDGRMSARSAGVWNAMLTQFIKEQGLIATAITYPPEMLPRSGEDDEAEVWLCECGQFTGTPCLNCVLITKQKDTPE